MGQRFGRRALRQASVALGIAVVGLAGALAPAAAGTGTIRWVDDDGHAGTRGCDAARSTHATVTSALAAAVPGDTIRVCPGTYDETLVVSTPRLTIEGAQPRWGAIISPHLAVAASARPANGLPGVITITADKVFIRWLKVVVRSGGCAPSAYGVVVENAAGVRVRGNRILNKPSPFSWQCGLYNGIEVRGSTDAVIAWNQVLDATHHGIRVSGSTANVFRNSIHYRHPKGEICPAAQTACVSGTLGIGTIGVGITIADGSDAMVRRNHIESDPISAWILSDGIDLAGSHAILQANTIRRVDTGIDIADGSGQVLDNILETGGQDGIFSNAATPTAGLLLEVAGNRVSGYEGPGIDIRDPADGGLDAHDNDFSGNGGVDCIDSTLPGSGNAWTNNIGDESNPDGICSPATP